MTVKLHDLIISEIVAFITCMVIFYQDMDTSVLIGLIILHIIIASIVSSILNLIRIIAYWRIFQHENVPAWKAIIPFYCDYTLCKLTDTDVKWSFLEFTPIISFITMMITYEAPDVLESINNPTAKGHYSPILYVVIITLILGKIVYSYILAKNTAKKFKKPKSFKWKLFFLPIIYYMKVVPNEKGKKRN